MRRWLLMLLGVLCFCGCSGLGSWRIFQKKIDPKDAEKSAEQVDAERAGAKFIEVKSATLEPDVAKQIQQIHAVAVPLSASLGEPAKPVKLEDQAAVIAKLEKGIVAAQKRADDWKAFAKKYAGTSLEGTGIDLTGIGGGLGLLLIIAGCIFVPGFGTIVLMVIRRLRGTVQSMAEGIEHYAAEKPEEAAALKARLSATMDAAHKKIVAREKQFVNWAKVAAGTQPKPA